MCIRDSIKSVEGEIECSDIVRSMPGHDIVVVEGYRKSGLPTIETVSYTHLPGHRHAEQGLD